MSFRLSTDPTKWLRRPQWLFIGGSLFAAVVAAGAEGDGSLIGIGILCFCVIVICAWVLTGKPGLAWCSSIVAIALISLGWTVEEPESALFQSVLLTAAVGWRIDRLSISVALMILMALVPFIGSLGPNYAEWGWWNWSVGTVFTWTMGRVIRLLELTLNELTEARTQLIGVAAREERRRISRDVHGLVGHSLTAMLLNIRAAQRSLQSDQAEAMHALSDAENIGTTGLADIRNAMYELRNDAFTGMQESTELASMPDEEAIIQLLERQDHIDITTDGKVKALHGPLAVAVYRILQECITNISKHALAGTAFIRLDIRSDNIDLLAENSLPPGYLNQATLSEKTLGLIGMRERVTNLGGKFDAGVDGSTWRVSCTIPRHD